MRGGAVTSTHALEPNHRGYLCGMSRRLVAATCVCLFLVAGCGGEEAPSEVTGTVTNVVEEDGAVASFELSSEEGDEYEIVIGGDVDYGFDLTHLHEHHSTGDPVHVRLEERDEELVALSIDDV